MTSRLTGQGLLRLVAGFVTIATCACGNGSQAQSPMQPTATLAAVTVADQATGPATLRLSATATYADGTRRDVTAAANWESSNTALAIVSSAGDVTVVADGQVEFRATYQTVTGRLQLHVSPAPAPIKYTLSGIVREGGTSRVIAGARVTVVTGPDAGAFVLSDDSGFFAFPNLLPGAISIEGVKDGYVTERLSNLILSQSLSVKVYLVPLPSRDARGLM